MRRTNDLPHSSEQKCESRRALRRQLEQVMPTIIVMFWPSVWQLHIWLTWTTFAECLIDANAFGSPICIYTKPAPSFSLTCRKQPSALAVCRRSQSSLSLMALTLKPPIRRFSALLVAFVASQHCRFFCAAFRYRRLMVHGCLVKSQRITAPMAHRIKGEQAALVAARLFAVAP